MSQHGHVAMDRQGGFTLIEVVVAIVVVGVAVAGLASLFVSSAGHSHEPYLRERALAVANAFMDEILNKRWDENTPLGGGCVNTGSAACASGPAPAGIGTEETTRAAYDDIDDYNAIVNQTPPQDADANAMPGYDGYSVSVNVTQPGAWNGVAGVDVKRIVVSVTASAGETVSLTAYRLNF